MKSHVSGSERSPASESRRFSGEKLQHVDEAAATTDTCKQGRLQMSNQTERKKCRRHRAEDPIRTLMFLGSWNHT
ncbi:hypothetical protein RIF29_23198 [Crotalaria pallida]|uniref:Uncharacterized protein n=1 Tax=Crotalaria pallida TaxID=3830 RepID=A0AAN9F9T6_CROPI